jgi:hypothetical protein
MAKPCQLSRVRLLVAGVVLGAGRALRAFSSMSYSKQRRLLKPRPDGIEIGFVAFDSHADPPSITCGQQCRPTPGERVQNGVARSCHVLYEPSHVLLPARGWVKLGT